MRKYEIMFIVKPDLEEKAVKETVKKLEKTLNELEKNLLYSSSFSKLSI